MSSFRLSLDLDHLHQLVADAKEAVEQAARPAAQAGAQVLYDAVMQNVRGLGRKTGKLASAIYQAYSPENSKDGRQQYNVSWNAAKAPHGHLVEFGHLQRYAMYQGNDGRVRPLVRPGMDGAKKPRRKASQAEKDAYYVPRPGGPLHIPGKAFVRRAVDQFPKAQAAMEEELLKRLKAAGITK